MKVLPWRVQQVLCVLLLLCVFQLCSTKTQGEVICSGTQNGASISGSFDLWYNLLKKMYTGCNIVKGNLEIAGMEHSRDFSFLQSIKEVTGYILFAFNEFSRLPLDNLRLIRGTTLYENKYALAVIMNYNSSRQYGVQELGLTHLTEILEGGVNIIHNKYLSYAPQVNWLDILKDETAELKIEDNGPEKPCDKACGDVPCWGPGNDTCQILTKTVCAPQCNGRCFGKNPSECCHSECAGGCTGSLDTDCFACKNFNNSGSCVPQCPQTMLTLKMEPNPNTKYHYGTVCVAHCPENFVVDDSSCVSNCPSDKMAVDKIGVKRCEPCVGLCPEVVICSGTQNGLSTTGNSEIQYNLMKKMYTGCNIVMGNLEITMMDHSRDFSFLQSIKEVTGYILFALNEFSRLPLDNLRVIRGTTLYENKYALAVMINYQKGGQYGVQELGLTHLTEILDGGVNIIQNKYLSYAPQVNWLDIVKDETAELKIEDNGPEKPCDKACGDVPCWGPGNDTCQILTKTVCAPQCNGRCFGKNPSECCHSECAGGCTGSLDTDCFACKNFNNSGSCVPQCPQTMIYNKQTFKMEPNPNAKYQYGSICVAQCPANFVVDDSSCVSNCPSDKMEVEKNGVKRCEPCVGLCPKVCHGTGSQSRQTVDAHNIDSFINCTKIQGNLHFLVIGIKGDEYTGIPALDPEKLKIFNTVQEITDILSIQSWPESMSDLSVFSNLQTIQGRTLYKGYSLLVVRIKSLTSLGLKSLQRINDGGVYITGNKNLCYYQTVNWTRILNSNSRQQRRQKHIDIKDNRLPTVCSNEGHVCDPLCSSDGCWGPGPDQCVSCKKYSRGGTCVPDCLFLTGEKREFATPSGECMPCHHECKVQEGKETCRGPGADQCVACASLQDGPHCVPSCPEGVMGGEGVIFKYPNKQGRCEPCHINCTQGCTGPGIRDCVELSSRYISGQATTGIVLGAIAFVFVSFSVFILTVLYRRGLAIRRKRAMRRYMESGENFEPLEEKEKVQARILKPTDLRKIKLLGNGVFGSVHKGIWIPEGDTVKLPVAIKTIHDRIGRQTFYKLTDHMIAMGRMNHINVVRTLGICPGESLQLVTQLTNQGSLLEHVRNNKNKLSPQRLLNWCVQIAKGMNYLEENRIVHRNLAARNVLLNNNFTAQISDYGIADLLYPDEKKYFYNEVKTPIKWMALESILFRRYTHQSDVWSYGVTIWEMMSYGTEPYALMRPQAVPDLLEKGERLSQPQICTIDVYMVMVKCWMIDENVRPTFKELASEFTKMARDPPRYLVIKEDCSQQDSPPDEVTQRSADLDDLDDPEIDLEDLGAEGVVDGIAPTSHYLSKSVSRLSRMDTHRVTLNPSTGTGYLPMTSGVDNTVQAMWQSRSRLNSARTMSESSEGCGTAVEQEMSEDFSLAGSLKRRRHREDSAYVSQRDSMSGGPPETPSSEMEEEDLNGYVLPGSTPERDPLLFSSRAIPGRIGKSHSGLLDDPDDEEYEYMNKQMCVTSVSQRHNGQGSKSNKKRTSSVSSQATACSSESTLSMEVRGGHTRSKDYSDSEQQGSSKVEYEYMDIRGSEKKEIPPTHDPPPPPVSMRMRGKVEEEEEDEYVEDSNYHYTNKQPKLRQALQDKRELKIQGRDDGEVYEYEDMDYFAAPPPIDTVVYQNMQREEEGAVGGTQTPPSGFNPHMKVQAGVGMGEPAAGDRSFDNPGYWHSRMFLKTNAVST
ncbi:receptor tyrosine-protein kinase erbB-3a isoform X2 [Melanotaenia boesemani]|uniref:receptor tyrosine-protein kinase erbB-3a isoform X2 n=1 Tax=Melanotaenia boesemani TaxID=1250792 RepID=UPI001C04E5BC|nr:receptor tyrosine-protein kinase erbB-3a isoform X2 [Melanotaenia boesemani]